jgi:pimeloyl-ACP methyl ester carboxylesterase
MTHGFHARDLIGDFPRLRRGERVRLVKGEVVMRVRTGRSELEVRVWGEGQPILTIHGAFSGELFHPLLNQPVLDGYKRIAFWRHGYRHSSHPEGPPYSVDNVVQDALAVLNEVASDSGHIVAHSSGGVHALQFALAHPEAVRTLTLIEPVVPTPEFAEWVGDHAGAVQEAAMRGDMETAMDILLTGVHGNEGYQTVLDPALPGDWFGQCVADSVPLVTVELAAQREWQFGPEEARQIQCPVLLIRGDKSVPVWIANVRHLKEWIPHAEEYVVSGAGHFELMAQPVETAQALANFLSAQHGEGAIAANG